MIDFFNGISTAGSWVVGLIFLRFWRETRDRFFALFGVAFWVMSLNWLGLVLIAPAHEDRHYFYVTRLIAFLLIIAAIVDKNRAPRQ
jgi:hypothetical protein